MKKESYRPFTPKIHYIPFTKSNPREIVAEMSDEKLKEEIEKEKQKVAAVYGWLHKSKRYKALMNEKEIRSGYITDKKLLKEFLRRKSQKDNPRKKEMKMGAPDKKVSLSKILDEIDETPNEYRFRMQPPGKFHEDSLKYGSKSITTGVRAIYGCPKDAFASKLQKCNKGMVMQSLRLSKDVFHSKTEAAGWIAKHTKPRRE